MYFRKSLKSQCVPPFTIIWGNIQGAVKVYSIKNHTSSIYLVIACCHWNNAVNFLAAGDNPSKLNDRDKEEKDSHSSQKSLNDLELVDNGDGLNDTLEECHVALDNTLGGKHLHFKW